jgi:hypothetical protein
MEELMFCDAVIEPFEANIFLGLKRAVPIPNTYLYVGPAGRG